MVTRNSAPASSKVVQSMPAKAKDSPWTPARKSGKKKSTDSSQPSAAAPNDMDLDDEVAFPKLASSADPHSSTPLSSLAVAASTSLSVAEFSPPSPPPPPHDRILRRIVKLHLPVIIFLRPPVLIVIILLFRFFLLRLHWQTIRRLNSKLMLTVPASLR